MAKIPAERNDDRSAGSAAIREHGMIDRPTEDVDLFTTRDAVGQGFKAAVEATITRLREAGYEVTQTREAAEFARLGVQTPEGSSVDIDLAVDWRLAHPVILDIGPVLALEDAVGNKVGALFGRAEPRDYLDVDDIRATGRFSDEQLLVAAAERDPGFDSTMFARQLQLATYLTPEEVSRYGVTPSQLEAIKSRCTSWAHVLRNGLG
ncbi:MAG TPA: nucleotidyl transferase AbiEii/AbiGii toxin family protein [Nocardioides sp.]|uniref:nucleotidyl transferase AbiEii/AbiGii toxin family protein n=1 Tax=uncultured Nocardioides sp. TaxID=198441 RepID=UPI0026365FB3|nr:nucleotidyl transferase AbiEii/AbiGii toxin family protein [uncultured Nocardioides sp.]HRD62627.1 nucleotidyl transferase AbiEii/AbiGii toxin family protein [Nocardioides sp.]HRI97273.1 nucleotidyl transferase AbiEii/AbiGii toxin family protein [Nocardioides sp.]